MWTKLHQTTAVRRRKRRPIHKFPILCRCPQNCGDPDKMQRRNTKLNTPISYVKNHRDINRNVEKQPCLKMPTIVVPPPPSGNAPKCPQPHLAEIHPAVLGSQTHQPHNQEESPVYCRLTALFSSYRGESRAAYRVHLHFQINAAMFKSHTNHSSKFQTVRLPEFKCGKNRALISVLCFGPGYHNDYQKGESQIPHFVQ